MSKNWILLGSNGQYVRRPLADFLAEMRELGLESLDFVPQPPHFWLSHADYEEPVHLLEKMEAAGLRISVLTPPAYRYSITAPQGMQREATVNYYRNSISLASALGADQVVLGAAGACWDIAPKTLRQNALEVLEQLCLAAEAEGISLLLAPVMGPNTPLIAESPVLGQAEELLELLRQVESPALGACLDTNVMASWGDTIPRWFELLGEKTRLVRLCDGNHHGWRAWGEGCLPMDRFAEQLRSVGYAGALSLLLPGERYIENPDWHHRKAVEALARGGAS